MRSVYRVALLSHALVARQALEGTAIRRSERGKGIICCRPQSRRQRRPFHDEREHYHVRGAIDK